MLRFTTLFLIFTTVAWAQGTRSQEAASLKMCGESKARFDQALNECIYCANGFKYNDALKCVGTPDVLGKCIGNDHYHAATNECMFCATGYTFNEKSRTCEITQ